MRVGTRVCAQLPDSNLTDTVCCFEKMVWELRAALLSAHCSSLSLWAVKTLKNSPPVVMIRILIAIHYLFVDML